MEAIRKGWDIHSANAANMYSMHDTGATYENIEAAKKIKDKRERKPNEREHQFLKYRDGAKTVGLGVMFGQGPGKMGHTLRISTDDAKALIATFFDTYPKLKQLIDDTHKYGHDTETTYTMLGRIRRLHRINNPWNYGIVAAEERMAFNTLIQGSEVEVIKCAMLQIHSNADFKALGGRMAMTVHDEIVTFAPDETAEDVAAIQQMLMADPLKWGPININLPIPVDPDCGMGFRWTEAH
jgi:DNA polymerase-1